MAAPRKPLMAMTWTHYADDLAELTERLDLREAIHVGHSAGGGEVARYIGRHGESRVAKVVLISAVTPSVPQTDSNPVGVPREAFEGVAGATGSEPLRVLSRCSVRAVLQLRPPGVTPSEAVIANWWRQGMMGGAKGQ
ncbi:MAG TPA: alpha/beta hydrolase [Acidothermaceae bacterium]|jgi:non-heme chloroperoxidase